MNTPPNTRRDFLKTAISSAWAWPAICVLGQTDEDCDDKLKQMRIRFQKGLAEERATLFKNLVSRYGPGVLELVREHTIRDARRTLQEVHLQKRDLDTVIEVLWKPSEGLLLYQVEQQTPDFLKLRVTQCLFADAMRKHGAAKVGLAFYCAYDFGFCEGLNPKIDFARTKTLMEGDAFCDHAYELKIS
jgi:hypothetical protein